MTRPIFFCDFDQTLIFSQRLVDKFTGDYNGLVVVESYNQKPSAFMTFEAVNLLQKLSQKMMFVPCSTRSPEQFDRLYVPGMVNKHTLLDNGGKIFTDGIEDEEWTATLLDHISTEAKDPAELYAEIERDFSREPWFKKARLTSSMFVAVIAHEAVPDYFIEYVESKVASWNYRFSVQSRSIYMIPLAISKEKAAAEIVSRYSSEKVFAAGDSILDLGMLESADYPIRPGHGELVDKNLAPHIPVTKTVGVLAGQEILEYVTLTGS